MAQGPPGVTSFDPTKCEHRAAFLGRAASTGNLWELSLLAHHFHRLVTKFAVGSNGSVSYKGDPLKDFTLQPFLDKFAFCNPKLLKKLSKQLKHGVSMAERKSSLSSRSAMLPCTTRHAPAIAATATALGLEGGGGVDLMP
jgi:hypothetical protein